MLACFSITSCGTTSQPVKAEPAEPIVEKEPVKEEVVEQPPVEEVKPVETPAPAPTPEDDEYTRSVGDNVSISKDTFAEDKAAIIETIKSLDKIMRNLDYGLWKTYIDDESLAYWQKPANLKKAQNRLPVKGLQIKSLEDYFKYVFVSSRTGREVSEIRYISNTYVKAVQVRKDKESSTDIIYYYFNKINGRWMLHLPPIDA